MNPGYHTPDDDASACDPAVAVAVLKTACTTAFLAAGWRNGLNFTGRDGGTRRSFGP